MLIIRCSLFVLLMQWLIPAYAAISDCELSDKARDQARELANRSKPIIEQKKMLQEAIRLCPTNAYAHNNIANLFAAEKQFIQAIQHYKIALENQPDLAEASYNLGKAYAAMHQLPLSLKNYLDICNVDDYRNVKLGVKQEINSLLKNDRYQIPHPGEVFDAASLEQLYEPTSVQQLTDNISKCGFKAVVKKIRRTGFKNLVDKINSSQLSKEATPQLTYLVDVIKNLQSTTVEIASVEAEHQTALTKVKQQLEKLGLPNSINVSTKLQSVPESLRSALASQIWITLE